MKQGDFTNLAKYYHDRPAYSHLIIEKLLKCINVNNKPLSELKIAEVGAGTGKLTKILAQDFSLNVDAVEPNENMRNEGIKYTKDCKNLSWYAGSAEDTTLPNNTYDWVIMASSFHWSDPKRSLPEFARILNGGGHFTAIWNPRNIVKGSIFDEIENEIKKIVPELNRVSSGKQNTQKWEEVLVSTGDFKDCFFLECDHKEIFSKERYFGAWKSSNDIQAQAGEKRWAEIIAMIERKIANLNELESLYKMRAWSVVKSH